MRICIQELKKLHSDYLTRVNESSVRVIPDILEQEFDSYKIAVSSFFVEKKDELAYIYKCIRENAFPYNKIQTLDVNEIRFEYGEYCEGLIDFTRSLLELRETDGIDPSIIDGKLLKIKERDGEFCSAFFCNADDCDKMESMDINTAMRNVEMLIDVYHEFSKFSDMIREMINSVNGEYIPQKIDAIKILTNSIRYYKNNIICEILACYEKIHTSIQTRTPVGGEKISPTYKLF